MLSQQMEGDTFSSPLLMFGHFSNHNDASLNLRVQKKKEPSKQMVTGQRVTWNRSQQTTDIEGCLCSTGSDKELPEYPNGIQ